MQHTIRQIADRGRNGDQRGAAAVEFAIVLPLLILLVFGIVQFSILYNRKQGLHAAAREGARLASLPQKTVADIQDHVEDALDGSVDTDDPTFAVSVSRGGASIGSGSPCAGHAGDTVTVTATVAATVDIPLFPVQTGTLTGKGEFRCE